MASGAQAVFARGAAAMEAGDLRAAERLFHQIVELDPRAHPAWNALAVVAVRAGLPEVAAEHAQRALELDRRNPQYLNTLGVALGELGRFDEAEQALRRALKAKPVYPEGLFNLGKALQKQGRPADALAAFERAHAMDRAFPGLLAALVALLRKDGRSARARSLLEADRALVGGQDFAHMWAACIADLDGPDAAIEWLRQERARHPGWQELRYHLAVLLLGQQRWREGWQEFLWRPNRLAARADAAWRPPSLPAALDGERVLLRGEQGLGDVLFFLRFAPLLRARGARITLACERRLLAVVAAGDALESVRETADDDEGAPGFDRRIWCGDLPALLESEAVQPAWALAADDDAVARARARLAALGAGPYLGVTWRAGTDTLRQREAGNERNALMKQLPPEALGAAVRGWPGTIIALQRDLRGTELEAFSAATQRPAHDLSACSGDLRELLTVLALLDEYVCVSNTNVHLLAGLGRAARVLVPYPPEWRWTRGDGPSPWFPGFSTYREPPTRGWSEALARLRRDLFG